MDAWADGINFYLAQHPQVKPRVLTHFEPWMALSFTEGSIGGDIERVNLDKLRAFYDRPASHAKADASARPLTSSEMHSPDRAGAHRNAGRRTRRLKRLRDCAREHGESPCAAAHQSAHIVLLSVRAAGHIRRRPEQRLRCRNMGPVLHLSGLQRPAPAGCIRRRTSTRSMSLPIPFPPQAVRTPRWSTLTGPPRAHVR